MMFARFKCWLLGCVVHREYPCCVRCYADTYEGDFIQRGLLEPVLVWAGLLRERITRRCPNCGKRMWWSREWTCSAKCAEEWIPF